MSCDQLRLVALLSALLHLADGLVTAVSHHHGDSPRADASVVAARDHYAAGCRHHDHGRGTPGATSPSGSRQPSPDSGTHDHDCAACRHLGQPLLHVFITLETVHADFVADVSEPGVGHFSPARIAIYQSRAPPGMSA